MLFFIRHSSLAVLAGALFAAAAISSLSGCAFAPRGELVAVQSQNRLLSEQVSSQIGELENLRTHNRRLEDKLIQSEEQLASLDQQSQANQKQLAAMRNELYDGRGNRLPSNISSQLANLSHRYPSLQFDSATGAAKLDTDVLFDPGEAVLKDDAQQMLADFAKVMRTGEARDLKMMVVGPYRWAEDCAEGAARSVSG